jgi:pyruvate formate lyase activating enzyme
MKQSLILDIKGNSLDDGPGIRTVIFFKGCPLSCVWCQNPESKKADLEISFDDKECIGCNTCMDICKENALSRNNPFFIDRSKCNFCFECVDNCPALALTRVGHEMSVDEVLKAVVKDKPFFDTSGGGVTLSGGEPAMFMDFTSELLKVLVSKEIHTLLETCGLFNFNRFEEMILPHIDLIYYDIKLYNADEHMRYCGVSNEMIIENFIRLHKLSFTGGPAVLPRVPLIPDITDRESNLSSIAHFLQSHRVEKVQLLPYNPLWHEKTKKIGIENPLSTIKSMTTWIDRKKVEQCEEIFRKADIGVM